ncbi:MAG TPA: tetratricopeptide repeat protein [bacterium]
MDDGGGIGIRIINHTYYLIPLIQILTVVHVIKTGRSWFWIWIILGFPLLGVTIYFFMEILPDFKGQGFSGSIDTILNSILPGRQLKQLQTALEETDTVKNRKALATYFLSVNEAEKAVELLWGCLTGVFKDEPDIHLHLAHALTQAGQFAEAEKLLEVLAKQHPSYYVEQRELLTAKCLEGLGQESQALAAYEDYAGKNTADMEGAWRYGQLLEKNGQKEKAKAVYGGILKKSKTFASHHRRAQRVWIKAARACLKELSKAG